MLGKQKFRHFIFKQYQSLFKELPYLLQQKEINRSLAYWQPSQLKELISNLFEKLNFSDQKNLLESLSKVGKIDFPDYPIYIYTTSDIERNARLRSCSKEPMTVDWLRSELKPGDVLYDIGANIGAYSLIAAYFLKAQGSVYAFEPNFLNFNQLCKNIILNNLQTEIIPLQVSLCKHSQLNYLHYQNMEAGGALHSFSRSVDYKADEFIPQLSLGMIGFSLNNICQIEGVQLPNLIKLDVDGLEYDILLGADRVLSHQGLRSILIEINEDLVNEAQNIVNILCKKGFLPKEKHQLFEGLYNYIFYRSYSEESSPIHFSEIPIASVRDSNWLKSS